jgi:hypothetical protein
MALHLNLLHEEILEQRQRQRDPLKIGILLLAGCGLLLFLYYGWNAYQTLQAKARLGAVERDWAKVEPKVTAAQKRAAELTNIINSTRALDGFIDNRFLWAPLLEKISHCVAPNAQLTAIEGAMQDDDKGVSLTIEGVAAAHEPRSAAEDFRQMLLEQLGQSYHEVKVEFKALEDVETVTKIGGAAMPMAHYTIAVSFKVNSVPKPTPTPGRSKRKNESS